ENRQRPVLVSPDQHRTKWLPSPSRGQYVRIGRKADATTWRDRGPGKQHRERKHPLVLPPDAPSVPTGKKRASGLAARLRTHACADQVIQRGRSPIRRRRVPGLLRCVKLSPWQGLHGRKGGLRRTTQGPAPDVPANCAKSAIEKENYYPDRILSHRW